ncbi:MAG: SAM-dependent methyltransferase [Actinobacteria bacterium]|nr:SAM-dependent methyltransferase [Actinomycetota bacterium]
MPSAADEIAAAIAADGPLRFDRYLELALYGEHGFYRSGGVAGRRGDFITSPEVGPLFGAVLARYLAAERSRLGDPAEFRVVEAGAGPGTLARSVLAATPGLRYTAVEVSADQRAQHPGTIESTADLPAGPIEGVVIANELLDNLPFRLLVFDGGWREAHVAGDGDRFVEVLLPIDEAPTWLPATARLGARVPWHEAAAHWVRRAASVMQAGSIVAFDYVTERSADLAGDQWRNWLRTYRGQQRGQHYLTSPGSQDITTQVALDQLPPPFAIETQREFLIRGRMDELVDEGRRAWEASAAAPTVAALTMRSRVREAEALSDPAGLGGFMVMTWRVPESLPGWSGTR